MSKVKSSKKNYAVPGQPMSPKQFEKMIQEAEKGPFYSLELVKEKISDWKEKYSK